MHPFLTSLVIDFIFRQRFSVQDNAATHLRSLADRQPQQQTKNIKKLKNMNMKTDEILSNLEQLTE
jgi:hypothetical protein